MYKAIKGFRDLQDDNHLYQAGDVFPRDGMKISAKRIKELSTSDNRRGEPMIVEVEDVVTEEVKEEKPAAKKSGGRKKSNAK